MAGQTTLNNLELTRGFEILQAQVNDLSNRLSAAIPEIENNLKTATVETKSLYDSIRSDILPITDNFGTLQLSVEEIGVRAKAEYQKIDQLGINTLDKINAVSNDVQLKMDKINADVVQLTQGFTQWSQQDGVKAQAQVARDVKADLISAKLEEIIQEVGHHKRVTDNNYQQQQMQLATAMNVAANQTGGGGGSGSKGEPLATNRLMADEPKLDGSEDKLAIEDWFNSVLMKVNLVYPGAQAILEWAATQPQEITYHDISSRADAGLANTVGIQRFVYLRCKTKLTAANHLKPLNSDQGLEAWRVLRKELLGIDGPRQEEEFNAIADLPKLKLAEMSRFDNLYVRWESELKKHELVNREYVIGKFKKQIVYKSLPDEFQKYVDAEVAKGQLQSYEES